MNPPFSFPPRLLLANGRLPRESQRLLELYLQGNDVGCIASHCRVSRDAMTRSLTSLVAEVRHLIRQMPSDSAECN